MTRKVLAYHEAGHAIMCLEIVKAFRSVSVVARDDSLGRIVRLPTIIQPDVEVGLRERRTMENLVQIAMAGEAAVCILKERKHGAAT